MGAAEVLERGGARRPEPFDDRVEDVDGGAGIGQRPVIRGDARTDVCGEGGELVVTDLVPAEHGPREREGVQHPGLRPCDLAGRRLGAEEGDVEAGVVRDQRSIAHEVQEHRQHCADGGCAGHGGVRDPGQRGDVGRDRSLGVDEGAELPEHLATADLHGTDLGDRVSRGIGAGGLEVHHYQRGFGQWGPEIVEAQLAACRHGRSVRRRPRRSNRSGAMRARVDRRGRCGPPGGQLAGFWPA